MEKLISMTDFVLQENFKIHNTFFPECVIKYAQFLKQPLTLGMFVPVDSEGNILNPPIERLQYGGGYAMRESEVEEYEKAKENVLFKGFELVFDDKVRHTSLPIVFHIDEFKTIEAMAIVWNEIELTESALKQIGINQ